MHDPSVCGYALALTNPITYCLAGRYIGYWALNKYYYIFLDAFLAMYNYCYTSERVLLVISKSLHDMYNNIYPHNGSAVGPVTNPTRSTPSFVNI